MIRTTAIVCLLATIAVTFLPDYAAHLALRAAAWAVAAVALHLYAAVAGRTSLGHAAFMSLGAYAGAAAGGPLAPVLAAGAAASLGASFAWVSARLTSSSFALATLALGGLWELLCNRLPMFGGRLGMPNTAIEAPTPTLAAVAAASAGLCVLAGLFLLERGPGTRWLIVRDTPETAESYGVNPRRELALAVGLGAGLAGFAGWLALSQSSTVSPSHFSLIDSLELYALVRLGKTRGVAAVALRGAAWIAVEEVCRPWPGLAPLLLAVAVIVHLRWQTQLHPEASRC